MAHYDLYSAIGLNRSSSAVQLAEELNYRIDSQRFDNPGGEEELWIARNVLGNEQTREIYDAKLADPHAPEITVMALRELGQQAVQQPPQQHQQQPQPEMAQAAAGGSGSSAAKPVFNTEALKENLQQNFEQLQTKTQPLSSKARSEISRSSRVVIIATAIITALVCLLIWALFSVVGGAGNSVHGAQKTVQELINLEEDDANSWMRDNLDRDTEAKVENVLQDNGDFQPFEDVVDHNDPQVGEVLNGADLAKTMFYSSNRSMEELLEDSGIGNYAVVTIGDRNGDDTGWRVGLYQRDGEWLITNIEKATDIGQWADLLLF